MKQYGTFYGVGVGPGDPELITLKTYRLIQDADVIVTPTKKMGKPSIAYRIVEGHIPEGKTVIDMDFPMISLSAEREKLEAQWEANADAIEAMLAEGKDVVFLTLGDPMVFSTYSYVLRFLQKRGLPTETLSGVPSFCNLAAQIGIPLTQGEESLGVVAMTQSEEEVRAILDVHKNIVIMKVSAGSAFLAEELEKRGLENAFVLVSNIGMDTQRVTRDIEDLKGKVPYLSTMLIKKDYQWL
ncbi:MAG: precorrin-2 C(20)-methyltransferase [Eubacteriaceae bacterium]|nr:precorrin-2 C(20)-methyltransferase [Eubacteriaceae bacterium]